MADEAALVAKLFDQRLVLVECQLARKSLIHLYYDLIDNECLTQEQAVFIAQYSTSIQGIQHKSPLVVA